MGYEVNNKGLKNNTQQMYDEKGKDSKVNTKWYFSYPVLILTLIFCFPCSFSLSIVRLLMVKNPEKWYKIRSILAVALNTILMIFSINIFFSLPESEPRLNAESESIKITEEVKSREESEEIRLVEETKDKEKEEQEAKLESESIRAEVAKNKEERKNIIRKNIQEYKQSKIKKYIQEIQKEDEELVLSVLKEYISQSISQNISDAQRISDIEEYCKIYEDAFSKTNRELNEIKNTLQQIEEWNNRISQIQKKYSFSIDSNVSIQTYQWYVSQRLSYDNDIVNALDEIFSEGSKWVAYDVVYIFDSPFPGDNCVILRSEELNPFSYSGSYTLDCVQTGEVETLVDANGFQRNVPIYDIINKGSLMADRENIVQIKYQIEQSWESLKGNYQKDYQSYAGTVNLEGEYILPDSSSRYLTESDLRGLDKVALRLARNEIYARHGRIFQSDDLNRYFSSKSWYNGYLLAEEFDDSVFNVYEKANLQLIQQMEN